MRFTLRPPDHDRLRRAADSRRDAAPDPVPDGFRSVELRRQVGSGSAALEAGATVLREWAMHHGAGVRTDAPQLDVGATVGLGARIFGVWLVFACRVVDVDFGPRRAGFTYATLPGHPEQGHESFTLELDGDERVELVISARWLPGSWVTRFAGPVAARLQHRATERYLDAMATEIAQRTSAIS